MVEVIIIFNSFSCNLSLIRYIHKPGKSEPEVEKIEYEGRLSHDQLNKLKEGSQRIEVSKIGKGRV